MRQMCERSRAARPSRERWSAGAQFEGPHPGVQGGDVRRPEQGLRSLTSRTSAMISSLNRAYGELAAEAGGLR
ncbi:hypothetical protein [Streptomyces sp. NPDC094466]|uniref:hypothetical protein n=1 Tax=Streptomyces sp. NPDC094466 TaxID=3366065 RepID=UPI0038079E09